jgi:hypothetical protein
MDGYLVKPVSIERLRATLERWLPIQGEFQVTSPAGETNSGSAGQAFVSSLLMPSSANNRPATTKRDDMAFPPVGLSWKINARAV